MGDGQLREWLDRLASASSGGPVSALEAIVASREGILFRHAAGFRIGGEPLVPGSEARFDGASLTKPWMATLALVLDRAGDEGPRLGLDSTLLPGSEAGEGTTGPRLEDLLRHRAGLPAWMPLGVTLGKRLSEPDELTEFLLALVPRRREDPPATLYSDLGYILWAGLAERRLERGLDELLDELVCVPLGLPRLGELSRHPPRAVECRLDNGKEVELAAAQGIRLTRSGSFHLGVPQDGNARALRHLGVPSGHAGLFPTADEMLELGREWLNPHRLLTVSQVESALSGTDPYALGWARRSEDGSSGPALTPAAFGHTGFTGGSLWIDPPRGRIYLLLAHRLSSRVDFNPFRREFHRLASELEVGARR